MRAPAGTVVEPRPPATQADRRSARRLTPLRPRRRSGARPTGPSAEAQVLQEGALTAPRRGVGVPDAGIRRRAVVAVGSGRRAARRPVPLGGRRPPRRRRQLVPLRVRPRDAAGSTRVADVLSQVEHADGAWGYGKIHAQLVEGRCGEVYVADVLGEPARASSTPRPTRATCCSASTRQRSRSSRSGSRSRAHGIPSLAGSAVRRVALRRGHRPRGPSARDRGAFFAYDVERGEVAFGPTTPTTSGSATSLVGPDGTAVPRRRGRPAPRVRTGSDALRPARRSALPGGGWFRASTPPGPDGTVYGVTQDPDRLLRAAPRRPHHRPRRGARLHGFAGARIPTAPVLLRARRARRGQRAGHAADRGRHRDRRPDGRRRAEPAVRTRARPHRRRDATTSPSIRRATVSTSGSTARNRARTRPSARSRWRSCTWPSPRDRTTPPRNGAAATSAVLHRPPQRVRH